MSKMLPASDPASVYTDFAGFIALRRKAQQDGKEALGEVASQFEALFLQMMLKSMRETSEGDPLLGPQGELYAELFDQQVAIELARAKPIGLADMLERAIGESLSVATSSPELVLDSPPFPFIPFARSLLGAEEPSTVARTSALLAGSQEPRNASRMGFVEQVWPHAQAAATALGVDPRLLVAQAALETGWGQYVMAHPDGRSANNVFGIKADSRWGGPRVEVSTLEYADGALLRVLAPFRAYASIAESFADYVELVSSNPRYDDALALASDPKAYIRGLQAAGYATDPHYAEKIIAILARPELQVPGLVASTR